MQVVIDIAWQLPQRHWYFVLNVRNVNLETLETLETETF